MERDTVVRLLESSGEVGLTIWQIESQVPSGAHEIADVLDELEAEGLVAVVDLDADDEAYQLTAAGDQLLAEAPGLGGLGALPEVFAGNIVALCPQCVSQYPSSFQGDSCLQCDTPLVDSETGTTFEPRPIKGEGDGLEEEHDSVVLAPFETSNPWLRKLFQTPEYGRVPHAAVAALQRVSADPEELLLGGIRATHGLTNAGMLLLTTQWIRWVRRIGYHDEEFWSYEQAIEWKRSGAAGLILLGNGAQFQARRASAKRFVSIYRLAQQALAWDDTREAMPAPSSSPQVVAPDLSAQMQQLADLYTQGLLSEQEFAQAKQRLLS